MTLHNEKRELQIRLTELQMKTQRKTTEYSTLTTLVLSSMIVIAFSLFTWAITANDTTCIDAGIVVAIVFLLFSGLNRYYSNRLDELEKQVQDLKKRCMW